MDSVCPFLIQTDPPNSWWDHSRSTYRQLINGCQEVQGHNNGAAGKRRGTEERLVHCKRLLVSELCSLFHEEETHHELLKNNHVVILGHLVPGLNGDIFDLIPPTRSDQPWW